MEHNPISSRTDRKTIERNRRNQMKALYSKLNSLVPHHRSRGSVSLPDQLDDATNYIKKFQTKLQKMKERKESIKGIDNRQNASRMSSSGTTTMLLRSPQIEIRTVGSALEVVLITGLDDQFMFNESIRVLHEEGADVVNASFSVVGDTVFHTIHSKVGDSGPSYAAPRISERLKKFTQDSSAF